MGSQGSAVSHLSALSGVSGVSGISRSPSPHKMLLETSFCGPKPLGNPTDDGTSSNADPSTAAQLEQAILARRNDLTQAIMAEGIHVGQMIASASKESRKIKKEFLHENNRQIPKTIITKPQSSSGVRIVAASTKSSTTGVLKNTSKPIVGVTSGGVEYIRIKLKPDHLYSDKGIGPNERVIDDTEEVVKKPATLSLGGANKGAIPKKSAPHFSQLVQSDDAITKHPEQPKLHSNNASPNLPRHIAIQESLSRTPSPVTISVSRKNSFCSLFKSKEQVASPSDAAIGTGQRKKSGISLLLNDSPRDRTRSKSREGDRSPSQNTTPSKQKSVLAILKPKRSGSKSKSASPVDPEIMSAFNGTPFHTSITPSTTPDPTRPKSRLRYYDEGKTVHIPLHTPPDEKENAIATGNVINERRLQNETISNKASAPQKSSKEIEKPIPKSSPQVVKPKPMPLTKNCHIENADGSIRIPLKSPTVENEEEENKIEDSSWSIEAQRNSSMESQETVISTKIPSQSSQDNLAGSGSRKSSKPSLAESESLSQLPLVLPQTPSTSSAPQMIPPPSTPVTTTPATTSCSTKERKRILFSTRIGSGSEEQIFATQLSLSKTESLSSQMSEQASILESPNASERGDGLMRSDTVIRRFEDAPVSVANEPVIERSFTKNSQSRSDSADSGRNSSRLSREEFINSNRHSRYIENIDQIMENERKFDEEKKKESKHADTSTSSSAAVKHHHHKRPGSAEKKRKPEPVLQIPGPPVDCHGFVIKEDDPFEVRASGGGGSSESERDSEVLPPSAQRNLTDAFMHGEESFRLMQQESFDDELPYVPTTLPEERSVGVPLVPIKERSLMEVKTCPVERPRSTTPMNPSCLEEYCESGLDDLNNISKPCEKLKISLPRKNSRERGVQSSKSPRRTSNASGKSWFEFAEQNIGGTPVSGGSISGANFDSWNQSNQIEDPPPLPPRKPQNVSQWINFENIPEKRKPPKRITTLPNKECSLSSKGANHPQYSYVNPEECTCECHEHDRDGGNSNQKAISMDAVGGVLSPEDEMPLLDRDNSESIDRNSIR